MAHLHLIEENDDVVDTVVFCSDSCHQSWCMKVENPDYQGWHGCNEISVWEPCAECGDKVPGVMDEEEGT